MPESPRDPRRTLWAIRGETLAIGPRPLVMGILNVTPDSFYDGGKYKTFPQAVERALELEEEGADLIDIGGLSTRPGSLPISWEEEADRVVPVIQEARAHLKVPLSVDTYHARVAQLALEAGAHIVNDVTSLRDPEMAGLIHRSGAGLVLMHMRGDPQTMQKNTFYRSLLEEILEYLKGRLEFAEKAGVRREQILIDPGIGFGKDVSQNLSIIRNLEFFKTLGRPILVGTSRKSFIGKILEREPNERLWGTLASVGECVSHGASVVRVHDVRATVDYLKVWNAIERGN